jgi:hypothetical protein
MVMAMALARINFATLMRPSRFLKLDDKTR